MKGTVHYEVRGRVAVLRVDNPPVNALSSGVRQGLFDGVDRAHEDPAVEAIVVVGDARTFPAGADITEFGRQPDGCGLADVLARMERSERPIVAAMHGTALGGGLETALCCDYRVADRGARLGLPEVKLGLLPGTGGTQRLPRLVGVEAALEMMLDGEPIGAERALALGLVDELVDGDLLEAALAFVERRLERGDGTRKVRHMESRLLTPGLSKVFEDARAWVKKRRRGEHAPVRILEAVEAAVQRADFDDGMRVERELFAKCMAHPQRAAMIHQFFAERAAAKVPDVPRDTPRRTVERAAVVGAGTMGRGIAMSFADAGLPVRLVEVDAHALERAMEAIDRLYRGSVSRGRMAEAEAAARLARIEGTVALGDVADADLVIEAVFEDLALKQTLLRRIEGLVAEDAIVATNTSSLDVDAMAAVLDHPGRLVGMHFFSPANVMKLLEVVRGAATQPAAIATAMALGKRLGKVAVLSGNCPGFIGNRMLGGYTREASFLVEEGATPSEVDRALVDFGMPMGPFAMMDLAGLDVGWRIRQARPRPEGVRYASTVADRLHERGRLGQKTRAGFYRYAEGSRVPIPDPEVEALIEEVAAELGVARAPVDAETIVQRCVFPLINEGARILEEGIALRASDIDVVYRYGYGFPAYRGGPMFHADTLGLAHVLEVIEGFARVHGALWTPAPLLARLAAEGGRFGAT